jgi:hypothetical protein
VRVTTINGEVSATEPTTNGLAAAAQREHFLIIDPHFELGTSFWTFVELPGLAGSPTGIAINATGGVNGGVLEMEGDSSFKTACARRSVPLPTITGQLYKIRVRWRRTTTFSSFAGSDVLLQAGIIMTPDGAIPYSGTAVGSIGELTLTRDELNAPTVNQWQETEASILTSNHPKSSTQNPYMQPYVILAEEATAGVVEIDAVHLVAV